MNRLALLALLVPTVLLAGSGSENHTTGPYNIDMGGNIVTAVGGGISSVVFTHGHTNTATWPYGCPFFDDLETGQDGDGTLTIGSDSTLPDSIPFMRGGDVTAYGVAAVGRGASF